MKHRAHPTHARYTRLIMIGTLVVAAAAWISAYLANESSGKDDWKTTSIVIYLLGAGALMMQMVLRDTISRCPQCKTWLRSKGQASERGTRIFRCAKCGVDWDTGVQISSAGEG